MTLKPIKLGKKPKLKYIPFSQLVNPYTLCFDSNAKYYPSKVETSGTITKCNSRALKTMKREDLNALKYSIMHFGLLKPFEVAELPQNMNIFPKEQKYVIIDGQRRYFAIHELFDLPSEIEDIEEQAKLERRGMYHHGFDSDLSKELSSQHEKEYSRLNIKNYVLIPCLVYPYTTFLECMRHSIEDNKFSVKPSSGYLELAERMSKEGIPNLEPENTEKIEEAKKTFREKKNEIIDEIDVKAEIESKKREKLEHEQEVRELKEKLKYLQQKNI